MRLSSNNLNNDQPKSFSKQNDKKSVNIKWDSKLFFQIGLILSLVVVYLIMETKFETKDNSQAFNDKNYLEEIPIFSFTIDEPTPFSKKKIVDLKSVSKIITKEYEIIPISTPEKYIENVLSPSIEIPIILSLAKVDKKEAVVKNIMSVEFVPVFPGCEDLSSNTEKRKCMSLKIKKFIVKNFNTGKLEGSSHEKEQKITVQFTISDQGKITNVIARAPNKLLESEAKRVVSNLPQMIPGRQGSNNVAVQYLIPITFKTEF